MPWVKQKDLTIEELQEKGIFAPEAPILKEGKFFHVFMEDLPLSEELGVERHRAVKAFEPTDFFDPTCPHCKPFLDEGAIMVYTETNLVGMRLLENGLIETVMLQKAEFGANAAGAN